MVSCYSEEAERDGAADQQPGLRHEDTTSGEEEQVLRARQTLQAVEVEEEEEEREVRGRLKM